MGQESQFRRLAGARKTKNSPPIFSQEFIIQNHGDIFSCIILVVFAGFMFHVTAPFSALLSLPQYNISKEIVDEASGTTTPQPTLYNAGIRDIATSLFYVICCIVAHAIVQEYILDKLQRKLHLSKTKTSKFTESGHLTIFSIYSLGHAGWILNTEGYLPEVGSLWVGYPEQHREMSLVLKLFFLIQIAYWLHQFPEFYFQKSKRDEIRTRSTQAVIYLAYIISAYFLNFSRVSLCILFLHYVAELLFHVCRMAHFAEKTAISAPGFKIWNIVFVFVRLGCVTLASLTFWYGLRTIETPYVDLEARNFNTTFVRLNCLLCVCGVQGWLMWNFITFHLRRMRERSAAQAKPKTYSLRSKQRKADRKERKLEEEMRNLPEADQETTRVLRSAKKQKAA